MKYFGVSSTLSQNCVLAVSHQQLLCCQLCVSKCSSGCTGFCFTAEVNVLNYDSLEVSGTVTPTEGPDHSGGVIDVPSQEVLLI